MSYLPDANEFRTQYATVGPNIDLAYVREGVGGLPLLLVHGWPGSKRLWWRNIGPLARAGFEVIVPDQRGFGESSVPAKGHYPDIVTSANDLQVLLEQLGHDRAVLVGGDFGSGIVQDMALRFPGLAIRQVVFNGNSPVLPELYAEHGITGDQLAEVTEVSNHLVEHGQHADELLAELDTPENRRDYVIGFYTNRVWRKGDPALWLAAPSGISPESAAFLAEPFGEADRFRATLGLYEGIMNPASRAEMPRLLEPNPTETLILYGPEDRIVGPKFAERCALACPNHVGPFLIPGAGHYMQWERPDIINSALVSFCRDLLAGAPLTRPCQNRPGR